MIKLMQIGIGQWAFLFGKSGSTPLNEASVISMGEWGTIFPSRADAVWAANAQKLVVDTSGIVSAA